MTTDARAPLPATPLTLRARSMLARDGIPPLVAAQLGPLLDQARSDGGDWEELIELFDVLDANGEHVFDMHLFCGDDGRVHRAGTLDRVAGFSQGGTNGTADRALEAALDDALRRWRAERKRARPA